MTLPALHPSELLTSQELSARHIPFAGLRYSTEAFIDYAIPACQPKYNYALIGPGVSQNAAQPVSLREPHGFQVGGVRIPHGKINTPHMHFTCEVFICTRGDWRVQWGFNPTARELDIGEGDLATIPTWIYRGFTNIGADDGFLFTALGGDNTGGIVWGPSTLAAAGANGVYLRDDYQIIDTRRGDTLAPGEKTVLPMTAQEIAALRDWPVAEMAQRVVRFADLRWSSQSLLDSTLPGCGAQLAAAIGLGLNQDSEQLAPVMNAHGLSIEWLKIPPDGQVSRHRLFDKQVLITKVGNLRLTFETTEGESSFDLTGGAEGWDSFALPAHCWRSIRNMGDTPALALLMTSGDHRKRIEWSDAVVQAAAGQDRALDANGYVAPKRFVDRAQR